MGIDASCFNMLRRLRKDNSNGNICAILGDATFHFCGLCTIDDFWVCDSDEVEHYEYSERSLNLIRRGLIDQYGHTPSEAAPIWFYDALGFDIVESFDINGNPTHKLDLCDPIPEQFRNKYDWVIDVATAPCSVDPSSVFKNIISMVKTGGYVLHLSQATGYFGRTFYSFSPALLQDVYRANGFEVIMLASLTKQSTELTVNLPQEYRTITSITGKEFKIPPNDTLAGGKKWQPMANTTSTYLQSASKEEIIFSDVPKPFVPMIPNDTMICCLAKKVEEKEFTKPVPQHFIKTNGR